MAADSYRLPFLLKLLVIAELTHFASFRCDLAFGELLHTRMARCAALFTALFTAVFASIGVVASVILAMPSERSMKQEKKPVLVLASLPNPKGIPGAVAFLLFIFGHKL